MLVRTYVFLDAQTLRIVSETRPMENQNFGISAALTTPFDADGQIDQERLLRHMRNLLSRGCRSVTLFGTTGEGPSIETEERLDLLGRLAGESMDPARINLALHGTSASQVAQQARAALKLGVTTFLLPPPCYYDQPPEEGLANWFRGVLSQFAGTDARFILYHIPQVIGVGLSVSLVQTLKSAFGPQVYGVKDSAGDFTHTSRLLALDDLQILVGDERQLARGARLGAAGAISGIANMFPQRLVHCLETGKEDPSINRLVDEVVRFPVTPAVKAMVAHSYCDPQWRRTAPPLVALDDNAYVRLAEAHDEVPDSA
ncbi:MAG TPA: dihydrodipicolinate synthase family protein [Devosia sp.]|nr:dihydrodipicolinate synthase family protein [Devosia sp.]